MKAIITFYYNIVVNVDDDPPNSIIRTSQRIQKLEDLLRKEFNCENAEVTGYYYKLFP